MVIQSKFDVGALDELIEFIECFMSEHILYVRQKAASSINRTLDAIQE